MKEHDIIVTESRDPAMVQREFELVERKGIGHPDTICDEIVEAVEQQLSQAYLQRFGRIMHHNIDKSFLVAGQSRPFPGGGEILQPMRFILGDRAVKEFHGEQVPLDELAEQTVRNWFEKHLRFVDPREHLVFQNEIAPGSGDLIDHFSRGKIGANDTSVGVGYAPLSPTERLVLALENKLNSAEFKKNHPESGEDIKVMACRKGQGLRLVVAMAFVDRFIAGVDDYFIKKSRILEEVREFAASRSEFFSAVEVDLNSLDDRERGVDGLYLTVLGTSAEAGDSGQVGRGNRINGIISYNRPTTTEAAAGKNPVSHTGKIYNCLSHQLAADIYHAVPAVKEVTVWLCSEIGRPLDQPILAAAEVKSAGGMKRSALHHQAAEIIRAGLERLRE
jgi:S-adenosylmethionine synthetase